ncbi:RICIN domain-containing protein [Frankia sp. Cr2]|uniref:RICIN domain-containing protein n=1 Tax=Frankia sp. Cr2 TaxID=3073932 RepID=UPI002AD2D08E|nr:RICIN domain-containing protein [Frankia sp. Cr2]
MIINRDSGLALDAHPDAKVGDHTCLWQSHAAPWQQWRLKNTDDGVAFIIENAASGYALDAGQDAENERDPHLWPTHWASWQQWIIVRLPLT